MWTSSPVLPCNPTPVNEAGIAEIGTGDETLGAAATTEAAAGAGKGDNTEEFDLARVRNVGDADAEGGAEGSDSMGSAGVTWGTSSSSLWIGSCGRYLIS